ncbi:MAG TPA: hypothetical protein VFO52_08115 [Longimicrobiales bacterium]|nr:hypothetical protein [Longimicrobiales bacterium]
MSAALLVAGGVALLFGSDNILPWLAPEIPESAAWLGQAIAVAWLALGALHWLSRSAVLGGWPPAWPHSSPASMAGSCCVARLSVTCLGDEETSYGIHSSVFPNRDYLMRRSI